MRLIPAKWIIHSRGKGKERTDKEQGGEGRVKIKRKREGKGVWVGEKEEQRERVEERGRRGRERPDSSYRFRFDCTSDILVSSSKYFRKAGYRAAKKLWSSLHCWSSSCKKNRQNVFIQGYSISVFPSVSLSFPQFPSD